MILNLFEPGGTPIDKQRFTWKELVGEPISKLDDDAFTRVRVILMNGIEQEALRFSHMMARMSPPALREALAQVRRTEHMQAVTINWLLGPDHSPLETTIAYEQVAIEVTAAIARKEPDPYLAQVYRFGLLEDFDHLYRYSALLDRLEGKDANNITQGYTDIVPGRPTIDEHRAPEDDLRTPYGIDADPLSKLHAITITAAEAQTQNYYLNIGPLFSDPLARQLYAEIATIEEQHVTQYGSLIHPDESWLTQWVLHEANEAYCYASCVAAETNPRIKAIWQRFLDYELGHLALAQHWFKELEQRDPAQILPAVMPSTIEFASQREFVRKVLREEVDLRASGTQFVPRDQESPGSREYRRHVNSQGSPSNLVAAGYRWAPGTELSRQPDLATVD